MPTPPDESRGDEPANVPPRIHDALHTGKATPSKAIHPLEQDYEVASTPVGRLSGKRSGATGDTDDDYFASKPTAIDSGPDRVYRPLLKPTLVFTGVAAAVLVFSNVASSASAYGTPFYNVANTVFRMSAVLAMAGLVMILIAYRIPALQRSQSPFRLFKRWSPMTRILIGTPLAIVGLWMGVVATSVVFGFSSLILWSSLATLFLAWLAVLALWHEGVVRAYAVGVIIVQYLQSGSVSGGGMASWLWMANNPYGTLSGSSGNFGGMLSYSFAGTWSLALLAGAMCSVYVWFLEREKAKAGGD